MDELLKAGWNVGVAWQDGRMFQEPYGIRMNLALPLVRVKEAFERLDKYVFHVQKKAHDIAPDGVVAGRKS